MERMWHDCTAPYLIQIRRREFFDLAGQVLQGKGTDSELLAPGKHTLRRAAGLSVAAALVWPLQAAVVALALGGLLTGGGPGPIAAALAFAGLGLARAALTWLAEGQALAAAEAVTGAARARILAIEATRAAPGAFGGAGAVAGLAGDKVEMLAPFVQRYAPARARAMVLPLVILALVLWQSWAVALILLVSGPLIPVFMALVGMAARDASARHLAQWGSLTDLLVERLSALADIRLLGAAPQVLDDFGTQAAGLRERTMAVLRIAFLSSTVLELFAAIGVAMVAVWVGFSLLGVLSFGTWGAALTPQAGLFLLLLTPDFFQPMRDLATAWHDRAAAQAVAAELAAWEADHRPALPGRGDRVAPLPGPASVSLTGCTTPGGGRLPDITVAAGEAVALMGPSGSGKTTALRLMAGLLRPDVGEVRVAGLPLADATADAWRARLGWMPQAPHFSAASLRANLTLGRNGDIGPALEAAAARDLVDRLPRGLATRLGETGGGLSGGEARRLTLARAVLGAPDVVLADEPTADLDADTARQVANGLLAQRARGATLIVATHDPRLAARMDRIIRLDRA